MSAFSKAKLSDREREKWEKIFCIEMMSSEEIEDENDTIILKPLPWRSKRVTNFFSNVDRHTTAKKSAQAKRQTKSRVLGSPSTRQPPTNSNIPSWALVDTN